MVKMPKHLAAWCIYRRAYKTWELALFTVVFFSTIWVSKMTNLNAVMSLVQKGYRLENCLFYQKDVNSKLDCAHLCLSRYSKCKSINFGRQKEHGHEKIICQLNNMTAQTTIPSKLTPDETFDYLEPVQIQKDYETINPEKNNEQTVEFQPFRARFTNLGASGRHGPTSFGTHYVSQDHESMVTLANGIQYWPVPYSGTYQITAVGAAGGYDREGPAAKGRGAYMKGDFDLEEGDMIKLLVGQEGVQNTGYSTAGGGGGTFVVTLQNVPLLVAGGGGGIELLTSRLANCDASTGTSGNINQCATPCTNWAGGLNGNGAMHVDTGNSGGGGGGFYSNGRSSKTFGGAFGNGGEGGRGFLQGGTGGQSYIQNGEGGFGGGGGAYGNGGGAGGGGGYSGGASGDNVVGSCGGGGGSYNTGNNQANFAGYNNGDGYVDIERLN